MRTDLRGKMVGNNRALAKNAYNQAESEVLQKNEKYKLFGEKISILLGFAHRADALQSYECEGEQLCRSLPASGRMVADAFRKYV